MLFWKEHKDDTEYTHYGRSRYVKVVNEDGAFVTTKVVVKHLCYMLVTPRFKWLYLFEETVKRMKWHKEGKRDNAERPLGSDGSSFLWCYIARSSTRFPCSRWPERSNRRLLRKRLT
jgi:hypothetical protein